MVKLLSAYSVETRGETIKKNNELKWQRRNYKDLVTLGNLLFAMIMEFWTTRFGLFYTIIKSDLLFDLKLFKQFIIRLRMTCSVGLYNVVVIPKRVVQNSIIIAEGKEDKCNTAWKWKENSKEDEKR